jgi:hypothetical protein
VLHDVDVLTVLTETMAFARSGKSPEDVVALFTARAVSLAGGARLDVRPAASGDPAAGATVPGDVVHAPVFSGPARWGELVISHGDGPVGVEGQEVARALAEVLGAALTVATAARVAPTAPPEPASFAGVPRGAGQEDLVDLVLGCLEELDGMPDASTRDRLTVVALRLAAAVEASEWSVGLCHAGRLHDVSYDVPAPSFVTDAPGGAPARTASVPVAGFPARLRASEGGAFYADRGAGDEAERGQLAVRGHAAVIGAGGYDLDGRSWVVDVYTDEGAALDHVTPTLAALVMAALCFPREAVVPRPEEPVVRAVLGSSPASTGHVPERRLEVAG